MLGSCFTRSSVAELVFLALEKRISNIVVMAIQQHNAPSALMCLRETEVSSCPCAAGPIESHSQGGLWQSSRAPTPRAWCEPPVRSIELLVVLIFHGERSLDHDVGQCILNLNRAARVHFREGFGKHDLIRVAGIVGELQLPVTSGVYGDLAHIDSVD